MPILILIFAVLFAILIGYFHMPDAAILVKDFGYYYVAWIVYLKGGNPYDPQLQTNAGLSLGLSPEIVPHLGPYMPWFFPLTSFFGFFEPIVGFYFFVLLSFIAMIAVGSLTFTFLGKSRPDSVKLALATMSFAPSLICVHFGQLSLFISLAAALFSLCVSRKRYFAAGALTPILTLKVHLFYLCIPLLIFWAMRKGAMRLLPGILLGHFVLILLGEWQCPGLVSYWVQSFGGVRAREAMFITPTLPRLIQFAYLKINNTVPLWPLFCVPLVLTLLTAVWLILQKSRDISKTSVVSLVCASLITSPYAWPCDYCILLPLYLETFFSSFERNTKIFFLLLLCQAFGAVLLFHPQMNLVWYWWFVPAIYLLWTRSTKWE